MPPGPPVAGGTPRADSDMGPMMENMQQRMQAQMHGMVRSSSPIESRVADLERRLGDLEGRLAAMEGRLSQVSRAADSRETYIVNPVRDHASQAERYIVGPARDHASQAAKK